MSTTHKIAAVISNAIKNTPALATIGSASVYADSLPPSIKTGITIDGTYSIEGKTNQRGATLHLWMPMPDKPTKSGDIEDMADALVVALKGSPILPSTWIRQPDETAKMDHVVFPVVVYVNLLN